ncbi:PREDICTED: 28S ribosomal protein S5, mitochondrial-like [Acropora digitifera]|uniref:28S ribosomal protein S5, mitochondrial-like n=1 Tax=Acropora digitifera TaxID=70779 RepID=UPI000779F4EC|nr:PREDICTED: 28S ribosomal protein S5, mitochondrial-like [Acropora digitifera]
MAALRKFWFNAVSCSLLTGQNCHLAHISFLKKDSWAATGIVSTQIFQQRSYVPSDQDKEYENLWAAVTGGRGTGRGTKKKVVKGVDPKLLKYDKAGLKWEGFNAPIGPDDEEWEKAAGRERGRMKTFERGWSGKTWPGRELGPPLTADGVVLKNFHSVVIELRRVSNMTPGGRKKTLRSMVVVGNKNGVAGFGVGKGQTPLSAMRQARNKAVNYLYFVERCDGHTSYGLRCHRAIKEIAVLLGITDMRCKVRGPTTPLSLVRAAFQGLLSQETHQELADRSGLNVVEFREECGMRPVIVASPSVESQRKVSKKREKKEYDLNEVFDPYRGLHRPKKRQELY